MHRSHLSLAAAALAVLLLLPSPAHAQSRTTMGWVSILAGGGLIAGAFNYSPDQCPPGYSTHTFQNLPTQCVRIDRTGSDVREATTGVDFARPPMMWSGLGAIGLGAVLLMIPDNPATNNLDIQAAPDRVAVTRTIKLPAFRR